MATPPAVSYPLDTRSTEQRVIDTLSSSPEVLAAIERIVEDRVNHMVDTIVGTVFPAISGASSLRYEMRREGNGVWTEPSSMVNLLTAFKHGRTVRLVAEFEDPTAEAVAS